jgi:quinol monooxygenase YgiN
VPLWLKPVIQCVSWEGWAARLFCFAYFLFTHATEKNMVMVHHRRQDAGALPSSSSSSALLLLSSSHRLVWLASTILVVFSLAVLQGLGPLLRIIIGPTGIYAFSLEEKAASSTSTTTTTTESFFSLLVELQFSNEAAKQTFLHDIAPLAEYVEQHEKGETTGGGTTLTYQVLQSDSDPLHLLMMERYTDKDHAYLRVHKQSSAFLKFRPKLQALQDAGQVTITGHSYSDTRIGFSHRGGGGAVAAAAVPTAGSTTAGAANRFGGVAGDGINGGDDGEQ